jgi:hypothetical protein
MSFLLIAILIAVVLFAGFRLVRHDVRDEPRSPSRRGRA